jgi:hypothetical protein
MSNCADSLASTTRRKKPARKAGFSGEGGPSEAIGLVYMKLDYR